MDEYANSEYPLRLNGRRRSAKRNKSKYDGSSVHLIPLWSSRTSTGTGIGMCRARSIQVGIQSTLERLLEVACSRR
jgi:hypothetical protein